MAYNYTTYATHCHVPMTKRKEDQVYPSPLACQGKKTKCALPTETEINHLVRLLVVLRRTSCVPVF